MKIASAKMKKQIGYFGFALFLLHCCMLQMCASQLPKNIDVRGVTFFVTNAYVLNNQTIYDELDEMAASNVTWISLGFSIFQLNSSSSFVFKDPLRTPDDDSIVSFVRYCRRNRMEVMIKPLLELSNDNDSSWMEIHPLNPGLWFTSYTDIMVSYAGIAQRSGASALSIGVELANMTQSFPGAWSALIANVRQFYRGILTYSSLPTEFYNINYLWYELDWIGIDAYFPLNSTASNTSPDVDEMVGMWKYYLSHIQAWQQNKSLTDKPIVFTEVGYGSYTGVAASPWYAPESGCVGVTANNTAQQLCYESLFQGVTLFDPLVKGIFTFWIDNPSTSDFMGPPPKQNYPCFFTPRGKPAMQVIATAYGA